VQLRLVGSLKKPSEADRVRIVGLLEAIRGAGVPVTESRSASKSAPGGTTLFLGEDELARDELTIVWPDGVRESLPRAEGLRRLHRLYRPAADRNAD
jgi:hypothetical protein